MANGHEAERTRLDGSQGCILAETLTGSPTHFYNMLDQKNASALKGRWPKWLTGGRARSHSSFCQQ